MASAAAAAVPTTSAARNQHPLYCRPSNCSSRPATPRARRGVLEAALSNRLSPGLYPYIRTAPAQPGETGPPGAGGATGHRRAGSLNWTRRDNWGGAGAAGAAAASAPARKLIVFILGGAAR
eukprot:353125-Chlamydomonas_euryale.AAC.12